jgi:hypothetical protein
VLLDPSRRHTDDDFVASPTPRLVVDRELVIRAANPAYLQVTQSTADELMGVPVFEAFPDNPADPACDGQAAMAVSMDRVLREGRALHLLVQRYDLTDRETGEFRERYWVPVTVPVQQGDEVAGVEVRVREVRRPSEPASRALGALRETLNGSVPLEEVPDDTLLGHFAEAVDELDRLAREAHQLREALTSRATIDQAKGILMARHGLTPDEAWERLVRLSNDTNVRVADVSRALVYQVRQPDAAPEPG